MRFKSLLALGAVTVTASFGLAACGGSGDGGSDGDKAAVEEVVAKLKAATQKADAAEFCSLFEPTRLKGWIGKKRCIKIFKPALKQSADLPLKIDSIDIDGDQATVTVDGAESKLQRTDGQWYLETPDLELPPAAQTD